MASAPPLPPRPADRSERHASTVAFAADDSDIVVNESNMSEQQLRELYDNEEIDRFLSLFSAYVTEVHLQDDSVPVRLNSQDILVSGNGASSANLAQTQSPTGDSVEGPSITRSSSLPPDQTLSEVIATKYISPALPMPSSPPLFTIGRVRLTIQRLYLATVPVYGPFFTSLFDLATWKNQQRSSIYCIVFWTLWYHNLLLPCLFLRIIYSLARRRIFSYPTLAELKMHLREIDRSNEFGHQLTARFAATSSLGVKELWRLFKVFNKPKKAKAEIFTDEKLSGQPSQALPPDRDPDEETATVFDSEASKDSCQENDVKRKVLQTLAEIADLHERVKNIFIWRRPASSKTYGMVLLFLFLITLSLPAKYLAKLTYFVGGLLFWHVTPVLAALSPSERDRLPPAFSDVPTDADHAMELISQRVAAGLDVRPLPSRSRFDKKEQRSGLEEAHSDPSGAPPKNSDTSWQKWADRAAVGKTWINDGRRVILQVAGQTPQTSSQPSPSSANSAAETYTFPAQHTSAPGLITLTGETLFFASLMSLTCKLEIPLKDLRSVKKESGLFNALLITWTDGEGNARVEKFRWVGGRDEIFARLVSTADKKRCIRS